MKGYIRYRHPQKSWTGILVKNLVGDLHNAGYHEGRGKDFVVYMDGNEVILELHPAVVAIASAIAGNYGLEYSERN